LQELDCGRGGSVYAGREQHDCLFSRNACKPIENAVQAGGEIELAKTLVEAEVAQGKLRSLLIGGEIEQRERRIGVAGDGHAISGGEAVKQGDGCVEMSVLKEIDGRARFDKEQNLCGIIHGREFGDGLFDAVIENVEVFPAQATHELAAHVGDDDANVYAFDGEADGRGRGGQRFLRMDGQSKEKKDQPKKAG